jgi:hypothetical protein
MKEKIVVVWGKLICDPLSADKPEAIGSEVRRKAREMLMEELERKGLIRYQMLNGVLYAGIRAAAPEEVSDAVVGSKLLAKSQLVSAFGVAAERLRELAEADKDGRLVVLPCKVGDKLYRVFAGEILEHKVSNMRYLAIQGRWDIDTTPFCSYVESSVGKTIFLTREEAEKALEAMKDV